MAAAVVRGESAEECAAFEQQRAAEPFPVCSDPLWMQKLLLVHVGSERARNSLRRLGWALTFRLEAAVPGSGFGSFDRCDC